MNRAALSQAEDAHELERMSYLERNYAATLSTFGGRLRAARIAAGLTPARLSALIAARPRSSLIEHYESGRRLPSVDRLVLIAHAVKRSPDYLLGFTHNL